MEAVECIATRRSVRRYTDQPVEKETIEKLVHEAQYAPTWKNSQTTRFTAVTGKAVLEQVRAAMPDYNQRSSENAPLLLCVSAVTHRSGYERDGSATTPLGEGFTFFDCGATVQTLCLAAHEAGLATLIMGIFDVDKVRTALNLPESEVPVVIVACGHAADAPQMPKRRATEEVLRIL